MNTKEPRYMYMMHTLNDDMLIDEENELNQAVQSFKPDTTVVNSSLTPKVHHFGDNPATIGTCTQLTTKVDEPDNGACPAENLVATENLGMARLGMGAHTTSAVDDGMR